MINDCFIESGYDNGEQVAVESGRERSEMLEKFRADFHCSTEEALEYLEWFEENWSSPVAGKSQERNGDKSLLIKASLVDIALTLVSFKPKDAYFGIRSMLWTLDDPSIDDALNHETPADWWPMTGKSKYMCYKRAAEIAKRLGQPKRRDQRSEKACKKMSETRIKQLK